MSSKISSEYNPIKHFSEIHKWIMEKVNNLQSYKLKLHDSHTTPLNKRS